MFSCDKCGKCCKNLKLNPMYYHLDRGDGICKYFNENNNECNIYDDRPIICNIDKYYETYLINNISLEEYYLLNKFACEELKKGV